MSSRPPQRALTLPEVPWLMPRAFIVRQVSTISRRRATSPPARLPGSEEHTSELQSLMRISYAVFCLKKKNNIQTLNASLLRLDNKETYTITTMLVDTQ